MSPQDHHPDRDPELLAERYDDVRHATEALCQGLELEDYVIQSMPEVSPTKWHLAHTSWFFETFVLVPTLSDYTLCHPEYGYLFNSYYETVGPRHARPQRGLLSRPTVKEIYAYRAHVDRHMRRLLKGHPPAEVLPLVLLGLHHEQQHQELMLTDIKHVFWQNPLRPALSQRKPASASAPGDLGWTRYEGGLVHIGHEGPDFAFDNESPRHRQVVEPFELASRLVTNGEYLAFIEDGGYRRHELWLSDGRTLALAEDWQAPVYWERRDGGWWQFTLSGTREVVAGEPVCHLSYYEADAYASWAGARLPSEAEWEIAASAAPVSGNFAETGAWHPLPARATPTHARPQQLFGDAWEWTRSPYTAYPGYRAPEGALGEYNGKFMSSQMVLRGGSCATPASHMRATYRNFWAPGTRWQFAGLRLARDV